MMERRKVNEAKWGPEVLPSTCCEIGQVGYGCDLTITDRKEKLFLCGKVFAHFSTSAVTKTENERTVVIKLG